MKRIRLTKAMKDRYVKAFRAWEKTQGPYIAAIEEVRAACRDYSHFWSVTQKLEGKR